jgi:hypothetical protein
MRKHRQRLNWYEFFICIFFARMPAEGDSSLRCILQSAMRSLAPLEAIAGFEKAQQIRNTLNALGVKKVSLRDPRATCLGVCPGTEQAPVSSPFAAPWPCVEPGSGV